MADNIIKVRDDQEPVKFRKKDSSEDEYSFALSEDKLVNWVKGETFTISDLRSRVEPWLTSLFQSEHLSLLLGSGLTMAIQDEAVGTANNGMGSPKLTSTYKEKIITAVKESENKSNRGEANIEDYIRVMNDLLRGLEILQKTEEHENLREELNSVIAEFAQNISVIENQIATATYIRKRQSEYVVLTSDNEIKLKKSLIDCGNVSVMKEVADIIYNIPELFVG